MTIKRLPLLSKLLGRNALSVDESIEGDEVSLEYVSAPLVTGRVVAIGEGCYIDTVRYSEEVEIHPGARVGNCEKID